MSQQTTPSTTGVATVTPAQRKRKKSPKPKEPKRAGETKRSKVVQRKEQDAAGRGGPQGQPQRQPPSHSTAEDDEVRAPPSSRRRVIDSDPPETPTSNLLSGAGMIQPHGPEGFNPNATADPRVGGQQDSRVRSSLPNAALAGQPWVPQPAPSAGPAPVDLQEVLESHGAQLRELGLYMREVGLLIRELLKQKLGHNAVLPPTPTLDGGTFAAPLQATSSQAGSGSATGAVENWSAPALELFSNDPTNGPPGAGDRSALGVGQPPQRLPQQEQPGSQSQSFTNGVAFNIGPIHQPITVAPLSSDAKADITNSSPNAPSGNQMPQLPPHQPPQPPQQPVSGPPSAEPHQTPGAASLPMFRDTSQPQMPDQPQGAFQMPGQQPSIRTPQIPPSHHDGSVTPVSAAPSATSGPTYPVFTNQPHPTFHHGHFVRPSPTLVQQQQALQHLTQQQQYQQQLHAQMQRQAAMVRQPPFFGHQQMVGLQQVPPGNPSVPASMGRPQRPPYLNTSTNLGGMGEDTEALPSAHAQMSPTPAQLANFQRAQIASYNSMRQPGGPGGQMAASSPGNQSFAIPHPQYGAMGLAGQNTFMGGAGLNISPVLNGTPPNNPASTTIGPDGTGSGTGGRIAAPPITNAGGSTDMATPSMYMYGAAEPSPFSANFPNVPGEESPFSFNPPEASQERNWGEGDDDDEEGLQDSPGRFNG